MSRSSRFRTKSSVTVGDTVVEIGRRANAPAIKIALSEGSTFIIDETTANEVADALDEALDTLESDPLMWE